MKKLYAFIVAAMATLSTQAQVVLTQNGKVCSPSETVVIKAVEEAIDLGGGEYFYLVECGVGDPKLLNQGKSTAKIKVTLETEDYPNIMWCGITDQCMPMPSNKEVREGSLGAGKSTGIEVHGSFEGGPDSYATYVVKMTVEAGGKKDVYTLNLVYDETCTAGINGITADTQKSAHTYDLSGRLVRQATPGQIYIRNGQKFIQR